MHLLVVSKVDLPARFLAVVLLASLVPWQVASAQQDLHIPSLEVIPGIGQESPISAPAISGSAYADIGSAEALAMQFKEAIPHTRSAQDVSLFRRVAPSVVLISTADGIGSGSVLQGNLILTSFHVIDNNREVTIVFKPINANGKPATDEVVKGDVVKVDVQRDLALVHPRSLPNHTVRPLEIATQDIDVGTDVHAIGHPKGEEWTYTKGIVSSVRPNYEWSYGQGEKHRATVIQTQTPINPGNSGGPLLSDDGKIVGVPDDGMAPLPTCHKWPLLGQTAWAKLQ